MAYTKKYIITGAPGTGKTTLINALSKDYPCMQEVSRTVIQEQQQQGGDGMPWQNLKKFATLVFEKSKQALQDDEASLFQDRGLPDLVAYLRHGQLEIPDTLSRFPFHEYHQSPVFYTPIWEEIYHTDPQRPTSLTAAKELETALLQTYQGLHFTTVQIPIGTPTERCRFIANAIANR